MLLMPSWGGMINGLLTLRGAWDKVRMEYSCFKINRLSLLQVMVWQLLNELDVISEKR